MAVYEQAYGPFPGAKTPTWSRFLVLPRYAFMDLFRSKIVMGFFVLCFVCPLVFAILIYLRHNVAALAILDLAMNDVIVIDARFFRYFLGIQGWFAFFLTMLVGPTLVSRDVANNGLALYLARPFSRTEYVGGKLTVIVSLLSAITWIPGLLLFFFESYLEGWSWFVDNTYIGVALLVGSLVWIVLLGLVALAISAFVKWHIASRALMIALYIIPPVFAAIVNNIFDTRLASIIDIRSVMYSIWVEMFRTTGRVDVPVGAAWFAVAVVVTVCLLLLARKVRAYEVVR